MIKDSGKYIKNYYGFTKDIEIQCDKCPSTFWGDINKPYQNKRQEAAEYSGWTYINGIDLCPTCSKLTAKSINK